MTGSNAHNTITVHASFVKSGPLVIIRPCSPSGTEALIIFYELAIHISFEWRLTYGRWYYCVPKSQPRIKFIAWKFGGLNKGSVMGSAFPCPLQWRHNERDVVSNHQPRDCFLNRLSRRRSKKTSKLRVTMVTGLCEGNSPMTIEFPTQYGQQRGKCFHLMTISWWRR